VTAVIVDVRAGLRQRLLTVAGLPAEANTKWEGMMSFKPTAGTPWMRETMLRAPAAAQRMNPGPFARLRHTGLYQISLFYPPDDDQDVKPIETKAEDIRAAFTDNVEFAYNGQRIRVHGAGIGTIEEETQELSNWLHAPITIDWSADSFMSS
jgi:hypothetical protein